MTRTGSSVTSAAGGITRALLIAIDKGSLQRGELLQAVERPRVTCPACRVRPSERQ